jgi:hypothetical protein
LDVLSSTPCSTKNVPSVVMSDGTSSTSVMNPLAKPMPGRDGEGEQDRGDRRQAPVVDGEVHEVRRERGHDADREVDLSADQQVDDAHRDDRRRTGGLGDVAYAVVRQEQRRFVVEVERHEDQDEQHDRLGASDEPPGAGAEQIHGW